MSGAGRDERRRDSLRDGYLPPASLDLAPGLALHEEADEELDPITFEVIRSKLWNLNWDHQETIWRTSGSLVVVQSFDFSTSIQTETGDGVVFGPGNWFFAGCADLVVKWTMEHRSHDVGIAPGDVFIQDDPWVGTNHAMDAAVYRPVFVDGRLFAWVYNITHQRELGGLEPGGFVQSARDVNAEATFWPPVKLGEDGVARADLMEAWVRRSRLPELMEIELRAQLAGVHVAHDRLVEIVERYGPTAVKGAMRRTIETGAETVARRLTAIPDGTWRDERYVAGALPEDRGLYRLCMEMDKRGGRLLVRNRGTSGAVGSFNLTRGLFRACVISSMLHLLAWDQQLCGAAVLRQLDFEFEPDAITSARHPHAISTALGLVATITQAQHLGGKLVSGSEEAGAHAYAASGQHTLITNHMSGIDADGRPFASFPFDGTTGAIGAFRDRDGIDHGGTPISGISPVGSVESYEQEMPILYLYRRELPHSGGHGAWRGGATFSTAWTGYGSDEVRVSSGGLVQSVTQGLGLMGGLPSTAGSMWHATGTPVRELLAAGEMPADREALRALSPAGGPPPPKKFDNPLDPGDLFETGPQPGAGYGDPLLRDPALVAADRRRGRLAPGEELAVYGVVLDAGGEVDADATAAERQRQRRARLSAARPPRAGCRGRLEAGAEPVTGSVVLGRDAAGEARLGCAHCDRCLGAPEAGYRGGCAELEQPLASLGPLFLDPVEQIGQQLVVRRFLCPECALALDAEICRPEDPPFNDLVVRARPR